MVDKLLKVLDNSLFDDYAFLSVKEYISYIDNKGFDYNKSILDYKTIITVCMAYPSLEMDKPLKDEIYPSRYGYGTDYHLVFEKSFDPIKLFLEKHSIKYSCACDNNFIKERVSANLSNLGNIGKNTFFYHDLYGSYVFLGTILLDIDIDIKRESTPNRCVDCDLCINACPSNSLNNGFNKELCISNISQSKSVISIKNILLMNKNIFGCDICQSICPLNKDIDFHIHPFFEPLPKDKIKIKEILSMTNKEFKIKYGNSAYSWRGLNVLKRNTLVVLFNTNRELYLEVIKDFKDIDIIWFKETLDNINRLIESK